MPSEMWATDTIKAHDQSPSMISMTVTRFLVNCNLHCMLDVVGACQKRRACFSLNDGRCYARRDHSGRISIFNSMHRCKSVGHGPQRRCSLNAWVHCCIYVLMHIYAYSCTYMRTHAQFECIMFYMTCRHDFLSCDVPACHQASPYSLSTCMASFRRHR